VFPRENGALVHPDLLTTWFRGRAEQAGVTLIRLHDLRHTHASLALQAGIPAKVVSERLGTRPSRSRSMSTHTSCRALQEDAAERIAALTE